VYILEHYFISTLFAAVRGAFSNAYKEEPDKTTVDLLLTKLQNRRNVYKGQHVRSLIFLTDSVLRSVDGTQRI
jgi:hypothetical protein